MGKKRLKRELRVLAERQDELERTHRRLAAHAEVIAVALRSSDLVSRRDLDDAIAGLHELNYSPAERSLRGFDPRPEQGHFGQTR